MARGRKRTPEISTLTRPNTIAYSRKQKPGDHSDASDEETAVAPPIEATDDDVVKAALATMKMPQQKEDVPLVPDRPTMPIDPAMLAEARGERPRVATAGMPMGDFGAPPEIPQESSPAIVLKGGAVEDPTHMPGPRDIPPGSPDDVASPPGFVPPGDSRSLRRRGDSYEFALVYRRGNAVISRAGVVGTRGVWRVVEYPTTASASHAYAREASRFVSEGFSDYRE